VMGCINYNNGYYLRRPAWENLSTSKKEEVKNKTKKIFSSNFLGRLVEKISNSVFTFAITSAVIADKIVKEIAKTPITMNPLLSHESKTSLTSTSFFQLENSNKSTPVSFNGPYGEIAGFFSAGPFCLAGGLFEVVPFATRIAVVMITGGLTIIPTLILDKGINAIRIMADSDLSTVEETSYALYLLGNKKDMHQSSKEW
ncbi:hypothetical protein MHK_004312, partial [Candidatus Magnetomorum sp. HK-1]